MIAASIDRRLARVLWTRLRDTPRASAISRIVWPSARKLDYAGRIQTDSRTPEPRSIRFCIPQARSHSFSNKTALQFGHRAENGEYHLACRGAGVDLTANWLRIFFGLSRPTNSATERGRYFSASDCGNARVGVLMQHPRRSQLRPSAKCETRL